MNIKNDFSESDNSNPHKVILNGDLFFIFLSFIFFTFPNFISAKDLTNTEKIEDGANQNTNNSEVFGLENIHIAGDAYI